MFADSHQMGLALLALQVRVAKLEAVEAAALARNAEQEAFHATQREMAARAATAENGDARSTPVIATL